MKNIFKNILYLRAFMLVLLAGLFAFSANAQTFTTNTPPTGPFYMDESADYVFEATGFDAGTEFILWYDLDNDFTFDENEELGRSSTQDAEVTFTYDWPINESGTLSRFFVLGAYTGDTFQDNALTVDEDDFDRTVVGTNSTDFNYLFTRSGIRYYQTEALDLSTTEDKTLTIRLDDNGLDSTNPVNVSFSTDDGVTFTDMNVASASTDAALVGESDIFGLTANNQTFTFDIPVDNASTIIRVSQKDAGGLAQGNKTWDLNSFSISIGDIYSASFFANFSSETVNAISLTALDVKDADDLSIGFAYPGDQVKVQATTPDGISFSKYAFSALITQGDPFSGDEFYFLESQSAAESAADDDVEVTGDIPLNIAYDESWDFYIVAHPEGSDPILRQNFTFTNTDVANFLSGVEGTGIVDVQGWRSNDSEFDLDGDRWFTTELVDIDDASSSTASIDFFSINTSILYPPGTEVVLEYSFDGTTFTQIGDAVDLNSDLSSAVEFDLSTVTDIEDDPVHFRVRQLDNNGGDQDEWAANLTINAGGNVYENGGLFSYGSDAATIFAPVIDLDPADIPASLVYPGTELTLTYDITNGEYPAGTTIMAMLNTTGDINYLVGTSTEIVTGVDVDNEINITIPPIFGGDYDVVLEPSTDPSATSNTIVIPVYETSIDITSVDSDNGIIDGTTDIIYPGDNLTINYDIEGEIGSGAELFFELYDYTLMEYVPITSTQTIDGTFDVLFDFKYDLDNDGEKETFVDIDNDGASNVVLRLRVGNGRLADSILEIVKNENDEDYNVVIDENNIFNFFDESSVQGNDPTDAHSFIGSGERSVSTLPVDLSFGGIINITFNEISFENSVGPQTVTLTATTDGGAPVTLAEEEYNLVTFNNSDLAFSNVSLPSDSYGEEVVFTVSYNADGTAGEFDNELEINTILIQANSSSETTVSAFDISASGQFRRPTIRFEDLDFPDNVLVVGQDLEVPFRTEGPFPDNTEFALVFQGTLDNGDPFETVVGTVDAPENTDNTGVFNVNVPDFAYEGDGTDAGLTLYDEYTIVAFDGTGGADYLPNEDIIIDSDDQFLVLEGTDEEDGDYTFDLVGDRSALTIAYDLSAARGVNVNFTYSADAGVDDNLNTIPQLQYSIDAGATFVNVEVEDSELEGGYLVNAVNPTSYSVSLPDAALTAATHIRFVQNLNLGASADTWQISGLSLELINGNEIDCPYRVRNGQSNSIEVDAVTVNHPDLSDYTFGQVGDDPIFNGQTVDFSLDPIFETSDEYPDGTTFEYLLYDNGEGAYVIDPETDAPFRLGSASAVGSFSATIPFFVENGSYDVRLIASKPNDDITYYYAGSEDDGVSLGSFEVFLRAVKTTVDFDDADVLYAGSTVTFNIDLENDETNADGTAGLYMTILAKNVDGDDDLVIYSQEGFAATVDVELPTYLRSTTTFEARLSEDNALGEVGDLLDADAENSFVFEDLENDGDNFISFEDGNVLEIVTPVYTLTSSDEYLINFGLRFSDTDDDMSSVVVSYSVDGGAFVTSLTLNSNVYADGVNYGFNSGLTPFLTAGQTLQYKWTLVNGSNGDNHELYSNPALYDDAFNFETSFDRNSDLSPSHTLSKEQLVFDNDFGRGLITTREFEAGELDLATLISLDVTFGELAEDIPANQFLIFEYSTDGGASYTQLASFPEVDVEELLNDETFLISVTDDMRSNPSIFRFRQEERNNINVVIDNFSFLSAESLPFDYVGEEQVIAPQVLLVTSVGTDASCLEESITIDYEVRGRFGADNIVTVSYDQVAGASDATLTQEYTGILSGTGSLPGFTLPTTVFAANDNNKNFRFRLNYDDDTFMDIDQDFESTTQPLSENSIEIVAKINLAAEMSVVSGDKACEGESLIVNIDDVQNYFTYQVIDLSDDSPLGSPLTYDPEDGETEIDLGVITGDLDLGLEITSNTSAGVSCRTLTSSFELEVELVENGFSFIENENLDIYELVGTGETIDLCQDDDFTLRVARDADEADENDFAATLVEWFRDDINTPVVTGNQLDENDINNKSGSYFARVTDGPCQYLTEAIQINVLEELDKPAITSSGGPLVACEDADPVLLEGPAGFEFYRWGTDDGEGGLDIISTASSVEVEEQGEYFLEVSNVPFSGTTAGCASATSDPIYVERYTLPEFLLGTTNDLASDASIITDGEVFETCESGFTVWFYDGFNDTQTASGGTIEIFLDGASVGFTNGSSYDLAEFGSGVFNFTWINDDVPIGTSCEVTSVSFTLNVSDIPDPVTITTTDALSFCEGEGSVTLTAPAGFAQYRWLNFGSPINSNSDGFGNASNTITVSDAGDYTVQVSNQADGLGCFSGESNTIEVNVRQIADDNISFNQVGMLCGPGQPVVEVFSTDPQWSYQFFEQNTDLPVGPAFIGSTGNSVFVTLDAISEQTDYYVIISYADGTGCPQQEPDEFFTATLNNVSLELDGNTITAVSADGNPYGWDEIEWFRNGVRLQQRSGDASIFVTDAAEYSAEVTYDGGDCVLTTNTVMVEGARIQTFFGTLEASTYPNPSSDFINVDMKGGDLGSYSVSVANLSGQVMLSEEFNKTEEEDSMTVDIRSIDKGIYTLIIRKGSEVQSFRIVKK